ncbi:hypothetical protein H8L32_06480 [Undibacterium sp. CY18W]|uniref:HTH cro/C1-type domain-containing protein n=1 Tax=Undibacterium hunanense TaxID=2762292 RepID=A0ABR6ZNT1_9BURK|nr:hypothetical protein [Undibacterium hunanense]MBC3917115.1 hypothetical protein [Undibacterium hunanense]
MRTSKYLDEVMKQKGFKRDKELAEWLEITAAAVAQYRSGARTMDNEKCVRIALELNIDPLKVIMASDMDKAERAGQHSIWEVFMTRMAATASALLLTLTVNLFVTAEKAEAAPVLASSHSDVSKTLYYVK